VSRPETLAQRRRALQQRSATLRERLAGDARVIDASLAQGLGLAKVALGAAGLGTALVSLRRRSGWRRMAAALRLLPLAWGVWRTVKAARTRG
jgi:hypothetical protein